MQRSLYSLLWSASEMQAKAVTHQNHTNLSTSHTARSCLGEQGEENIQFKQLSVLPQFWALTFAEQLLEGSPSQRTSNLQSLWNNCRCDELVVGHFFAQFVVGSLVKQDKVVQLVPHFPLGPLLLGKRKKKTNPLSHLLSNDKRLSFRMPQELHHSTSPYHNPD